MASRDGTTCNQNPYIDLHITVKRSRKVDMKRNIASIHFDFKAEIEYLKKKGKSLMVVCK
jgi:hypothetical protein